jgi:hypothetical protein
VFRLIFGNRACARDAGFGFNPVFEALESRPTKFAVVGRLAQAFRRL